MLLRSARSSSSRSDLGLGRGGRQIERAAAKLRRDVREQVVHARNAERIEHQAPVGVGMRQIGCWHDGLIP